MTKTRTEALEELAAEWEGMARGTSQFDATLRVCALKVRGVLAAYPEAEPVPEWAAGFEDGQVYNRYRTQDKAEAFVKDMNESDANMVVLTREYTPAFSTEWRAV